MGLINHFLIEFEVYSACNDYQGQESVARHVTGSREEPITTTSLNANSTKSTPNNLPLYP